MNVTFPNKNAGPSRSRTMRASPELSRTIETISAVAGSIPATLGTLRAALQQPGIVWSEDGELLFPQDRTALVIEVDELIDVHGSGAAVADMFAVRR